MRSSKGKLNHKPLFMAVTAILLASGAVFAQTSVITYQGHLNDGNSPANGNYDLQFALFDSLAGPTQIGATQTVSNVPLSGGNFTVALDFGANAFPGAPRFMEISVRTAGGGVFTTLSPRQQITSTPQAIRALKSGSADSAISATNATNATQLGGVAASQYVLTSDARLTDARSPTAGSTNYLQNTTTQQAANFNIAGSGTVGTNLSVGGTLSGNGSGLTNLNPANISSGTANINISGNAATATNATQLGGVVASRFVQSDANGQLSVQVVNTPNVSVSNTPNVNVANTPNVNVVNTLGVNVNNAVALADGTSVNVNSSDASPIFVRETRTTALAFQALNVSFSSLEGLGEVDVSQFEQIRVVVQNRSFAFTLKLSVIEGGQSVGDLDVISVPGCAAGGGCLGNVSVTRIYEVPGRAIRFSTNVEPQVKGDVLIFGR